MPTREDLRKNAAEAFSAFVNSASSVDMKALAEDLCRDHRTLVQQKFSMFLQFTKVLADADKSGNYDLRNEYSVKTATKIMNLVNGVTGVPFV